jgi:hypothetical protein
MAIMETLSVWGEDEVLALRIIPLEGPFFLLPSFPVPLGAGTLGTPALRIPVNPSPPPAEGTPAAELPSPELPAVPAAPVKAGNAGPPPPFPLRPVQTGGRTIQERSRALWEEGRTLEALAELRRNERDHPAGFTLVRQRRDLEQALGLEQTADEIFRPRILLIPALILCLILAALGLTVPGILPRGPGRRGRIHAGIPALNWIVRIAGFMFTLIALFCLLRLTMTLPRASLSYRRTARQALSRDTVVYQVPEDTGTEIDRFREGQGILVYETRGGWAYAESVEGQGLGWIRPGTYLIY